MLPEIRLVQPTRDDVMRIAGWLEDPEVNGSWYGTNELDEPIHIGYSPKHMLDAGGAEWESVFGGQDRHILSVLSVEGEHIGEAQMIVEVPLLEAQLFVLIGRKDLWYWGFGTAAIVELLDMAFDTYGLHRAWVEIPEFNLPAIHMCERLGFILEGRLRNTYHKDGEWYDSLAMGLLSNEYPSRRASLMGEAEAVGV